MTGAIEAESTSDGCVLTLDNRGKRNAVTPEMLTTLDDRLAALEDREVTPPLVLTGSGSKAFCSGFDTDKLDEFDSKSQIHELFGDVYERIRTYPQPTIAGINGDAVGGGLELLLAADLRISVESAQFRVPAAARGLTYSERAIERLQAEVGPATAAELLFTAEPLPASRLSRAGLLNRLTSAERLDSAVRDTLALVGACDAESLAAMKATMRAEADT